MKLPLSIDARLIDKTDHLKKALYNDTCCQADKGIQMRFCFNS